MRVHRSRRASVRPPFSSPRCCPAPRRCTSGRWAGAPAQPASTPAQHRLHIRAAECPQAIRRQRRLPPAAGMRLLQGAPPPKSAFHLPGRSPPTPGCRWPHMGRDDCKHRSSRPIPFAGRIRRERLPGRRARRADGVAKGWASSSVGSSPAAAPALISRQRTLRRLLAAAACALPAASVAETVKR